MIYQVKTRALLSNEPFIMSQVSVRNKLGRSSGDLLCFLHSWERSGRKYAASLEALSEELGFSVSTTQRAIKKLKDSMVLQTFFLSKNKRNRTMTYFINHEELEKIMGEETNKVPPSPSSQNDRMGTRSPSGQNDHLSPPPSGQNDQNCIRTSSEDNNIIIFPKSFKGSTAHSEPTSPKIKNIDLQNQPGSDTASGMTKTWIKHTGPVQGAMPKAAALEACLKTHFNGSLDEWEKYCKMIAQSKFLMGETGKGGKAFLAWAIKEESIEAVLSGAYDQNRVLPTPTVQETDQLAENEERYISELDEPGNVRKLRLSLLRGMGYPMYKSWIKGCVIDQIGGHSVDFKPPTRFMSDWIKKKLLDQIRIAAAGLFQNVTINGKSV